MAAVAYEQEPVVLEPEAPVANEPEERVYLPYQPQPWETAAVLVGAPGAIFGAISSALLLFAGARGADTTAWLVAGGIVGGFLLVMAVLWTAAAGERRV